MLPLKGGSPIYRVSTLWSKPWAILKTTHWISAVIHAKQDDFILSYLTH